MATSILFIEKYLRLSFIFFFTIFYLNNSQHINIALSASYDSLDVRDLTVYLKFVTLGCTGESPDLYFNLISGISCHFDTISVLKWIIALNILVQMLILSVVFSDSKIAVFLYFSLGGFYWANYNTLTASLTLTFLLLFVYFVQRRVINLSFPFLSLLLGLVGHLSIIPTVFAILAARASKLTISAKLFLLSAAICFLVMASLTKLEEVFDLRYLNYIVDDGIGPTLAAAVCFALIHMSYFPNNSSLYINALYRWSVLGIMALLIADFFVSIQNDIIARLAGPLLFIILYCLMTKIYRNGKALLVATILIAYTSYKITSNANGWSYITLSF